MGRYGMAGNYYRRSGYVTLQDVPDPNREYVETFDNLTGGMNTFDLDFRLKGNESPLIQNLSWHNGVLCSRRGQVQVKNFGAYHVQGCYDKLWHGWLLFSADGYIYAWKARIDSDPLVESPVGTEKIVTTSAGNNPGEFATYHQYMFYKARGKFLRISYNAEADTFSAISVVDSAIDTFVPCIQMNSNPETGKGEQYQPINRLTGSGSIKYNGKTGTDVYMLPFNANSVTKVKLNGITLPDSSWSYLSGEVTFLNSAPPDGQNNVEIFYELQDDDALNSILSCSHIAVFGGAQDLCIVLSGCEAQPNAYFWSGNSNIAMDPTYFPYNQYNLAGDAADEITGFGKQQNMLVIFQPHSVGRAVMGTEEINGRTQITMNYTRINSEIGCDLPRTIQLVENNLVWCSRRDGVCYLKDSSAAYENNIVRISEKIDGDYRHPGLLDLMRSATPGDVWSTDTGTKYVVGYDGKAYEWNYDLSRYDNPSWFSHTGIQGLYFVNTNDGELYEITQKGVLADFQRSFADFGEGIEKIYVLPPRNFGTYDRLKNIMSMIFTTRGDANTNTQIEYTCDYSSRIDPMPLAAHSYWLSPRNLSFRNLACNPFAYVARRKPGYHNIRHLQVKLYNNEPGDDLSLVSAQIFYTFRGRQR